MTNVFDLLALLSKHGAVLTADGKMVWSAEGFAGFSRDWEVIMMSDMSGVELPNFLRKQRTAAATIVQPNRRGKPAAKKRGPAKKKMARAKKKGGRPVGRKDSVPRKRRSDLGKTHEKRAAKK